MFTYSKKNSLDVLSNTDFQTMDKSIIIITPIVTYYVLNIPRFILL